MSRFQKNHYIMETKEVIVGLNLKIQFFKELLNTFFMEIFDCEF